MSKDKGGQKNKKTKKPKMVVPKAGTKVEVPKAAAPSKAPKK